jgi:hypothetical protein
MAPRSRAWLAYLDARPGSKLRLAGGRFAEVCTNKRWKPRIEVGDVLLGQGDIYHCAQRRREQR